jgi:hypothetical protein
VTTVADPISERVNRLVREHISSASQVEVLCLLVKERRAWSDGEVSQELRLPLDHARGLLRGLAAEGLVRPGPEGYRFAADSAAVAEAVEELVEIYHRYRLRITSIIYAQPSKPIADAGGLRLRSPDGDKDGP